MNDNAVFKALADKSRRKILDLLFEKNGRNLNELCTHHDMSRQAVMKHLRILEKANLVSVQWSGREKRHFLNPVPIQETYGRWIHKFERQRLKALDNLKMQLERGSKKSK